MPTTCRGAGPREAEWDREGGEAREHDRRVYEHAAVTQDGVESQAVGGSDLEDVEGAGDEDEHDEEERQDRGHDPRCIGGQPKADPRARQQGGAA
jgi:hypothetical protein